uniref:Uncharacterized protein n=1 Tax=Cannabis sativa TaxID=3483 RepID=A0A803NW11_CANSA
MEYLSRRFQLAAKEKKFRFGESSAPIFLIAGCLVWFSPNCLVGWDSMVRLLPLTASAAGCLLRNRAL